MFVNIAISGTAEELAGLKAEDVTAKALTLDFIPDDAHVFLTLNTTESFERTAPMENEIAKGQLP